MANPTGKRVNCQGCGRDTTAYSGLCPGCSGPPERPQEIPVAGLDDEDEAVGLPPAADPYHGECDRDDL